MSLKILNVCQLHIYELLKFVLKTLSNLHHEPQLKDKFPFVERRITGSSAKPLLVEPICRRKIEKRSYKARTSTLFNAHSNADSFLGDIVCGFVNKEINLYHNFKEIYFVINDDIVKSFFA